MTSPPTFATISALAGDPARAAMLHALMDGRALTAAELAAAAGIAPQTAGGHIARLADAGLVAVARQGRHRYHRLASASVARMIEAIMQVASEAADPQRRVVVGPRDATLRRARTCYDHLAGELGVALADALVQRGHIELGEDAGTVTEAGVDFLRGLGIEIASVTAVRSGRALCRPCIDWSERRPHLAGRLGATICSRALEAGWVRRIEGTRAVEVTPKGRRLFRERFGIT